MPSCSSSRGSRGGLPSRHACAKGPLPADAAGIRKALDGADVVLMIGGAFFDDVWYAPGTPFPDGARIAQIETAPATLAHKLPVEIGLTGHLPDTLRRIGLALAGNARDGEKTAATAAESDDPWNTVLTANPVSVALADPKIQYSIRLSLLACTRATWTQRVRE